MTLDKVRGFLGNVLASDQHIRFYDAHPINHFWLKDNLPIMESAIREANDLQSLVHRADSTFMFSVNEAGSANRRAVNWLTRMLSDEYGFDIHSEHHTVSESEVSLPTNSVRVNGRLLTPDFLRCYLYTRRIESLFGLQQQSLKCVVELGAGTGHLARLIQIMMSPSQYIIVDLPWTLAFSYAFLSTHFPEKSVMFFEPGVDAQRLQEFDLVFVPAEYAEALPIFDVDLVINTASLGEMSAYSVRYWMNMFQETWNTRRLYWVNRFLNTIRVPENLWRCVENETMFHFDNRWRFLQWELEPPFTRCPYVDSQIARYVEIAAERCPPQFIQDLEMEMGAIQDEDWFRLANVPPEMTLRDSAQLHRLDMQGSLFSLWDAARLTHFRDVRPLSLLHKYLMYLRLDRNRPYEEEIYLGAMVTELRGDDPSDRWTPQPAKRWFRRTRRARSPELVFEGADLNVVHYLERFFYLKRAHGRVQLEKLRDKDLRKLPSSKFFKLPEHPATSHVDLTPS